MYFLKVVFFEFNAHNGMKTDLIHKLGCKDIDSLKVWLHPLCAELQGHWELRWQQTKCFSVLSCQCGETPAASQPTQRPRKLPVNMFLCKKNSGKCNVAITVFNKKVSNSLRSLVKKWFSRKRQTLQSQFLHAASNVSRNSLQRWSDPGRTDLWWARWEPLSANMSGLTVANGS